MGSDVVNPFNKANYYALFISIMCKKTAKESLMTMGISPDKEEMEV